MGTTRLGLPTKRSRFLFSLAAPIRGLKFRLRDPQLRVHQGHAELRADAEALHPRWPTWNLLFIEKQVVHGHWGTFCLFSPLACGGWPTWNLFVREKVVQRPSYFLPFLPRPLPPFPPLRSVRHWPGCRGRASGLWRFNQATTKGIAGSPCGTSFHVQKMSRVMLTGTANFKHQQLEYSFWSLGQKRSDQPVLCVHQP